MKGADGLLLLALRGRLRVAAALATVILTSCGNLREIPPGQCGNGVKEGTEDCDTFPNDPSGSLTCGAPGTQNECRYLASADHCPAGYVGGVDGVCRAPTSRFEEGFQLPGVQGVRAEIADFDGDGVGDLTLLSSDRARRDVVYSESSSSGTTGQGSSIVSIATTPFHASAIADMNGDLLPDLVQPSDLGLSVLLSRPERDFVPFVFQQFSATSAYAVAVPSSALYGAGVNFATPPGIIVRRPVVGTVLCFDALKCNGPGDYVGIEAGGTFDPSQTIAFFADLDGVGAPDLVYAQRGGDHVVVVSFDPPNAPSRSIVTLPGGKTIEQTVAAADLDGDGHVDLLTSTAAGLGSQSRLLRGPGPITGPSSVFLPLPDLVDSALLAAGDINADGFADLVTTNAVYASYPVKLPTPKIEYAVVGTPTGYMSWTSALIGDLDADGIGDVAAMSPTPGIDVFLGHQGVGTTPIRLSAEVGYKTLVRGDIDGDGVGDLVVSTVDHPKCNGDQQVLAYFGQPFAPPVGPTRLSEAPGIEQLVATRITDSISQVGDALDDLLVVTAAATPDGQCSTSDFSAGVLFGTPERRPLSVLRVRDATSNDPVVPMSAVAGDVDGDGSADVLMTASLNAGSGQSNASKNALFAFRGAGPAILSTDPPTEVATSPSPFPDFLAGLALSDADATGHRGWLAFEPRLDLSSCSSSQGCDFVLAMERGAWNGAGYDVSPIDLGAPVLMRHFDATQPLNQAKVLAADLDADGDLDLVGAWSVPLENLPSDASGPLSAMFVLRNDGGVLVPSRVPLPDGRTIVDFALAAAPASILAKKTVAPPSVLVATDLKLYALEGSRLRALAGAREIAIGSSQTTAADAPAQRITSVTTGDVDGDGLEDVVMVTTAGVRVLRRMATFDTGAVFSLDPNESVGGT